MAVHVMMPRKGDLIELYTIVSWKKKEGDTVKKGEELCQVESSKAVFVIESPASGTLLKILYPEQAGVYPENPIALIGNPGEDI